MVQFFALSFLLLLLLCPVSSQMRGRWQFQATAGDQLPGSPTTPWPVRTVTQQLCPTVVTGVLHFTRSSSKPPPFSSILVLSLASSASSTTSPHLTLLLHTSHSTLPNQDFACIHYITTPSPIHNLPILYTSHQPSADVPQTKLGPAGVDGRATACCGSGGWLPRGGARSNPTS